MQQVSITHMQPLTTIRRARMLPVRGQVHVRKHQKISAADIVASGYAGNEHLLLDVRRILNIRKAEQLEGALQCKPGDRIQKDDALAESGGMFRRVLRSPVEGQIVTITAAGILIEIQNQLLEVFAGIAGTVIEVIPERGAILEAEGALLQGVWGNGKANQGMLLAATLSPEEALGRETLNMSMRGAVLLGGRCEDADALKIGADLPLRGLILGSMTADLVATAQSVNYPVIVLDGFGTFPMNAQGYKILVNNEKRDACLNASPWDPFTGEKPEVVIPLPASGEATAEVGEWRPGKVARITTMPLLGKIGVVVDVPSAAQTLPNGIRTSTALVRLENNEQIFVPLANLDMLE
ncbi:MAG: hypothetical protein IT308_11150 [Anaerolineaceae bacterium]|nr:hypothetical protein [Anaerolineaceae bacterium]